MNKLYNPNCNGNGPCSWDDEVRVLPLSKSKDCANLILCKNCFNHEMLFRKEGNKKLTEDYKFDLPEWANLKVYSNK